MGRAQGPLGNHSTPSIVQAKLGARGGAHCVKCGSEKQFQETQTQRDRRGGLEGWGPPGSACLSTHLGRCPAENQPHRIPCRSRVSAAYNSLAVTTTITIAVKLFFIAQTPVHALVLNFSCSSYHFSNSPCPQSKIIPLPFYRWGS